MIRVLALRLSRVSVTVWGRAGTYVRWRVCACHEGQDCLGPQEHKYTASALLALQQQVPLLQDLAAELGVSAMPTFFLFWQGNKVMAGACCSHNA